MWVVSSGPVQGLCISIRRPTIQVLAPGDELDGGDVLPGFRLSVKDLFAKAGSPA